MKQEILSTPVLLESAAAKALAPVRQIAQRIRTDGIRRIYIAARGSSSNAGLYFRYLCEINSHITVVEINPSVFTVYGSHIDMTGGILVAVSQGGRGVDIRKVAEEAARQGIPSVAVTDFPDSPLARCCEYVLPLSVEFERSMAATKSFTAELLTLNMLASELADIADVSAAAPAAFRRGLGLEAQISAICPQYADASVIYVIGRGKTLSLARELCCKLQETCLVSAFPFSAADFMHGPFALVDDCTRAVLLHTKYAASESTMSLFDSMLAQGAEVLVITDDDRFPRTGGNVLYVDSSSEDESVFAMTAVLQLFAAELTKVRGTDPDTSRNLEKYTETL